VQNILMFRFSNSISRSSGTAIPWIRPDHVSEKLGVGERGGYYEEPAPSATWCKSHAASPRAHRDGPPVSLEAEAVRDEKVKLLKSIRALSPADV